MKLKNNIPVPPQSFDQFAKNYHDILSDQLKRSGLGADYFALQKAGITVQESLSSMMSEQSFRLLDVGCGNGMFESLILSELARQGICDGVSVQLEGIEVSAESVKEAQARRLPSSTFREYDGQKVPFKDGVFDLVVFCVVMHHVPLPMREPLLRECWRVLRPRGALLIFEHNPLNPLTQYIVKRCPFDKDAVLLRSGVATSLIRRTGFRVVKRRFLNFFPNRGVLRRLMSLERFLQWVPMGAQYYIRAEREG